MLLKRLRTEYYQGTHLETADFSPAHNNPHWVKKIHFFFVEYQLSSTLSHHSSSLLCSRCSMSASCSLRGKTRVPYEQMCLFEFIFKQAFVLASPSLSGVFVWNQEDKKLTRALAELFMTHKQLICPLNMIARRRNKTLSIVMWSCRDNNLQCPVKPPQIIQYLHKFKHHIIF